HRDESVDTPASASPVAPSASSSSPKACPSDTSTLEVLRRPVEFTQYLSLAYTDRLSELGIAPSVGSRGDSSDNALAEALNVAYKAELISRGKPWRCVDDVEMATTEWMAWYTQERLHEALSYQTPAEYEAALNDASHREPANSGPRNRLGIKPGVVHMSGSLVTVVGSTPTWLGMAAKSMGPILGAS